MSRINTNVASLIATRVLDRNNDQLKTALTRLSTGLRINTGKDDPAGLIASEMMRADKVAIDAAINNARRADNIVAVAEGGLQEVSALLLELESLVDQTANEAGLNDAQVNANQLQIDSILDSINRIANSTSFQGKKLLDGSLSYQTSGVNAAAIDYSIINGVRLDDGASRSVAIRVTQSAQAAQLVYTDGALGAGGATISVGGKLGTEIYSFASGITVAQMATAINQNTELTGVTAVASGSAALVINSSELGSDQFVTVEAISGTFDVTGGDAGSNKDFGRDVAATINGTTAVADGAKISMRSASLSLDLTLDATFAQTRGGTTSFDIVGGGADFSIGPDAGMPSKASLGIQAVTTASLGDASIGRLYTLGSGQTNQLTNKNFNTAQRVVRSAIEQVSFLRGRLGAFQKNTLQPTINSLQVSLENITAAESAVRDADFAVETSNLTRAQILVQSAMSGLQLANAMPQNVLSLIQ